MSMFELDSLTDVLSSIKPNLVTPHLASISTVYTEKKPRLIADILMDNLYQGLSNPVTKSIIHKGEIHQVRHFNIEPLKSSVWSTISILILHLSYGEQVAIIEALYPESLQLVAKAFAITFTNDDSGLANLQVTVNDDALESKLDANNAGIATIIAMLSGYGFSQPHPDKVKTELTHLTNLVTTSKEVELFKQATKRSQDAAQFRDRH